MKFLSDNIKWIIFIAIILIGSNLITGVSVNSFSRMNKIILKRKLDSLDTEYKQLDLIHINELAYRRKIFLEDSILEIKYLQEKNKDKVLIIKQKEALTKYKLNSSKVNIFKLDSCYNAEN